MRVVWGLCGEAIYYLFWPTPKGSPHAPRRSWPLDWVELGGARTSEPRKPTYTSALPAGPRPPRPEPLRRPQSGFWWRLAAVKAFRVE